MIFALCDCNNFFVSCERLFRPDLAAKPVVVLSSNDGCVISRSNEAKALGIAMGIPFFKVAAFLRAREVTAFSSNFALYQEISRRVMPSREQNSAFITRNVFMRSPFLLAHSSCGSHRSSRSLR